MPGIIVSFPCNRSFAQLCNTYCTPQITSETTFQGETTPTVTPNPAYLREPCVMTPMGGDAVVARGLALDTKLYQFGFLRAIPVGALDILVVAAADDPDGGAVDRTFTLQRSPTTAAGLPFWQTEAIEATD